jgi:hypothetical protein
MKSLRFDYDGKCADVPEWERDALGQNESSLPCRKGWSIAVDGIYVVSFERFLIVACLKALEKVWIHWPGQTR